MVVTSREERSTAGELNGFADVWVPEPHAVPVLGASLQKPFREYLEAQRAKMHHRTGEGTPANENWLSWVFEKVIVVMVCFFVCPIVNSMAQSYAKRQQQQKYYEGKTK
ncbi:unnamed protein product [Coregonus sp. 'balchen']|nr:unnamed protein product [Coregonus sp. 'balchen']